MPMVQELYDFVNSHRNEIDLNKVNINSEHFKSLPVEKQHEIILSLKNASRIPSQQRVEEMVNSSKTSKDFSISQIKNLVHRATLTDRYHSTLKDKNSKVAFTRRVDGYRQRDFILTKSDGAKGGWNMEARENQEKIVTDLAGLQGFTSKPASNIVEFDETSDIDFDYDLQQAIIASKKLDNDVYKDIDFVPDEMSTEDLWNKILLNEQGIEKSEIKIDEFVTRENETLLEKYLPVTDPAPALDRLDSFESDLFPPLDEQDVLRQIALIEKRLGKSFTETSIKKNQSELGELKEQLKKINVPSVETDMDDDDIVILESYTPKPKEKDVLKAPCKLDKLVSPPVQNSTDLLLYFDDDSLEVDNEKEMNETPKETISITEKLYIETGIDPITEKIIDTPPQKPIITPASVGKESEVIVLSSDDSDIEWTAIEPAKNVDPVLELANNDVSKDFEIIEDSNQVVEVEEEPSTDVNIDVPIIGESEMDAFFQDFDVSRIIDEESRQREILKTHEELVQLRSVEAQERKYVGEISQMMIDETQELLELFGIPFISAPMEAESQCASLFLRNHVDGIVTDDSDVFLFGGDNIYKNLFDNKRYVEKFTVDELVKSYGLKRAKLIQMAYLLGSDYTPGIKGIGPVRSIEIVNSWPSDDLNGLKEFKQWVLDLQAGIVDKNDTKIQKNLVSFYN